MVKRWEIVQTKVTFVLSLIKKNNNNKNQRQRNRSLKKSFDGRKHDTKVSQTNADFLCEHYTFFFFVKSLSSNKCKENVNQGGVFTGITKTEIIRAVVH